MGLDTGSLDGVVPTNNINTITYLNIGSKNISDLTGIEDFTVLDTLICWYNQLTNIDITQNIYLTALECSSNNLTSLDVSQNNMLSLLYISNNNLLNLNTTQNITLTELSCGSNLLTNLDLNQNIGLSILYCPNNQLTNLNVSQNIALTNLTCSNNELNSLNINQNVLLTQLYCDNNLLNCLNVKNGNNSNFTDFFAFGNTNLTCIEVDDVVWSTANWISFIDAGATFSTNCGTPCSVGISEYKSSTISIFPNPTSSQLILESGGLIIDEVKIIDFTGRIIKTIVPKTNSINVADLPCGIYFIQLTTKEQKLTQKFVKN